MGVCSKQVYSFQGATIFVVPGNFTLRYSGQGQQMTATLTDLMVASSLGSCRNSNSWRLGLLAGVAAKSWTSTRCPDRLRCCAKNRPADSSTIYVSGL